ncbi:MAG TPA: hypothetical protein VF435_19975, partial [Pyrinomonadaceae bacterium]
HKAQKEFLSPHPPFHKSHKAQKEFLSPHPPFHKSHKAQKEFLSPHPPFHLWLCAFLWLSNSFLLIFEAAADVT